MGKGKGAAGSPEGDSTQPVLGKPVPIVAQVVRQLDSVPDGYEAVLDDLKRQIRSVQLRAALAVNRELLQVYWRLGREVALRGTQEGWGEKVIIRLAKDLNTSFPGVAGFSRSSIYRMRAFYFAYSTAAIVPPPVRQLDEQPPEAVLQLPWGHNVTLLERLTSPDARLWYAEQAARHGWSRSVLVHHIDADLRSRQGQALTNFERTLPSPRSDLAREVLKDPYTFDFLTLAADARERDLERGLVDRLRDFLLELGVGFAFVGRQYHLEVGGKDYYLDLLFYHLRLRCFVVLELKVEEFEPEHAGKMNFYLSAVDDRLRHEHDKPSIGLILCKDKNRVVVEYSLRDTSKPMGVASYEVRPDALPAELLESLPSVEQLEAELRKGENEFEAKHARVDEPGAANH